MAIGDAATAAGLITYTSAQDRRLGYQNDNQRGDDIANAMKVHRQLFGVNSIYYPGRQEGTDRIAGSVTATLTKVIDFPVPFASGQEPNVKVESVGFKSSTPSPSSLGAGVANAVISTVHDISLTSFTVTLRNTGGNFATGRDWYFDWSASGVLV